MNRAYLRPPLGQFKFLAVLVGLLAMWGVMHLYLGSMPTLQKLYWPDYVTTGIPDMSSLPSFDLFGVKPKHKKLTYQVLYCYRINGREIPVTGDIDWRLSPHFVTIPLDRAAYNSWLWKNIFGRRLPIDILMGPGMWGMVLMIGLVVGGYYLDQERNFRFRTGARQIRGPELITARRFAQKVNGNGMGFRLDMGWFRKPMTLRIEQSVETQHIMIVGDTGSGKTQALFALTDEAERMNETCVIYDPHREFVARYYNPERGDIILGLDERCATWSPSDEIEYSTLATAQATALGQSESMYPGHPGQKDWFFTDTCRRVWSHAVTNYKPNASELAEIFTHIDPLLDAIVKGTDLEETLRKNAEGQRAGIAGTLTQCLFALLQIPAPEAGRVRWSARDYCDHRRGWLFFTSTQDTRVATTPLQRLWIDSIIRRILSMGARPDLPRVRIVIDELPTLGELSQIKTAVSEGRKSGLTLVMGFQGRSQIEDIYGKSTEAIVAAPYTKVVLRTGEPEVGDGPAKILGKREVERINEHVGPKGERSYTTQLKEELVVFPSELANLKNRCGYVRYAGYIVPIKIALAPQRAPKAPGLVPRIGKPVNILPMPNLAEIKRREEAEKQKNATKYAGPVEDAIAADATVLIDNAKKKAKKGVEWKAAAAPVEVEEQ
jgi:Type IV secretion-system coupling protein DNA-binding domain